MSDIPLRRCRRLDPYCRKPSHPARTLMRPALLFTARYGPQIAEWLFAHQDQIADGFPRFRAQVLDTVSGRSQSIDRIGAALVTERDASAKSPRFSTVKGTRSMASAQPSRGSRTP